jgi:hypothetical protein
LLNKNYLLKIRQVKRYCSSVRTMVVNISLRTSISFVLIQAFKNNLQIHITQLKMEFLNERITLWWIACSMLKIATPHNSFWAKPIATSCYLQNLSFTKAIQNSTLYQIWTSICPDLFRFKNFWLRNLFSPSR